MAQPIHRIVAAKSAYESGSPRSIRPATACLLPKQIGRHRDHDGKNVAVACSGRCHHPRPRLSSPVHALHRGRPPGTSHALSRTFVDLGRNIAACNDDQREHRANDANSLKSREHIRPYRCGSLLIFRQHLVAGLETSQVQVPATIDPSACFRAMIVIIIQLEINSFLF